VPVLWDKKTETVVNNESSEIIRIFNTAFNDMIPDDKAALDLYPEHLRKEIDEVNEWVYDKINSAFVGVMTCASSATEIFLFSSGCFKTDGVYKAGIATSQKMYTQSVTELFEALDRLEKILTGKDYLVENQLTEADVRLYATIVSF
jgi:glutathionyl-hydroquinone reductase